LAGLQELPGRVTGPNLLLEPRYSHFRQARPCPRDWFPAFGRTVRSVRRHLCLREMAGRKCRDTSVRRGRVPHKAFSSTPFRAPRGRGQWRAASISPWDRRPGARFPKPNAKSLPRVFPRPRRPLPGSRQRNHARPHGAWAPADVTQLLVPWPSCRLLGDAETRKCRSWRGWFPLCPPIGEREPPLFSPVGAVVVHRSGSFLHAATGLSAGKPTSSMPGPGLCSPRTKAAAPGHGGIRPSSIAPKAARPTAKMPPGAPAVHAASGETAAWGGWGGGAGINGFGHLSACPARQA